MREYIIRLMILAFLSISVPMFVSAQGVKGAAAQTRYYDDYVEINRRIDELEREDEGLWREIEDESKDVDKRISQQNVCFTAILTGIGIGIALLGITVTILSLFWRYQQKKAESRLNQKYEDYQAELEKLVTTAGLAEDRITKLEGLKAASDNIFNKLEALLSKATTYVKRIEKRHEEVTEITEKVKRYWESELKTAVKPSYEEAEIPAETVERDILEFIRTRTGGERLYERIISGEIDDASQLFKLGGTFSEMGNYEKAENIADLLINKDPENPIYHFAKGLTANQMARYGDAVEEIREAIRLGMDTWEAHFELALTLMTLDKYDEAYREFDKVTEIKPDHALAYAGKGSALILRGMYGDAIREFNTAIRWDDQLAIAHSFKGAGLLWLGEEDAGISAMSKAIELEPEDPRFYYNRACAYSILRKKAEMLNDLEESIRFGDEEYRELAKTDDDFTPYRDDPDFRRLVYPEGFEGEESE